MCKHTRTQTAQSCLLVFGGVNHPAHEQQTVCFFMVYEEEKWPVDKEGPGQGVWSNADRCGSCSGRPGLIHLNHSLVQHL